MASMKEKKVRETYLVENHCILDSWRKQMNKTSRKMRSNGEPGKGSKGSFNNGEKVEKMKRVKIYYDSIQPLTNFLP